MVATICATPMLILSIYFFFTLYGHKFRLTASFKKGQTYFLQTALPKLNSEMLNLNVHLLNACCA